MRSSLYLIDTQGQKPYFFKGDMFGKLEKLSKFKNKIDSQAEFLVDDERG